TINGYSQFGASPNTLAVGDNAVLKIQLDGTYETADPQYYTVGPTGVALGAANCVVEGLDLTGWGDHAILVNANNCTIAGNFVGTDPTGETADPNSTSPQFGLN